MFVVRNTNLVPKCLRAFLEYPFFVVRSSGEERLRYQYKDTQIEIIGGRHGLPTITDKDLLIYCISLIMAKVNSGGERSGVIRFSLYDYLKFTGRSTCGTSYRKVRESLLRLKDMEIRTNIEMGELERERYYQCIHINEGIFKTTLSGRRMISTEIVIADWILDAIQPNGILTINRDYFSLKPLEKLLYGILRKHLGNKSAWSIFVKTLYSKMAIKSSVYELRRFLKKLSKSNTLPDFRVQYCSTEDRLYVFSRGEKGKKALVDWLVRS